jgi:hypothetical protein
MTDFALNGPDITLIDGDVQVIVPHYEAGNIVAGDWSEELVLPNHSFRGTAYVDRINKIDNGAWKFTNQLDESLELDAAQINDLACYVALQQFGFVGIVAPTTGFETENGMVFLKYAESQIEMTFEELGSLLDVFRGAQVIAADPYAVRPGYYHSTISQFEWVDIRNNKDTKKIDVILVLPDELEGIKTDLHSLYFMHQVTEQIVEQKREKMRQKFAAVGGCISCEGVRKNTK